MQAGVATQGSDWPGQPQAGPEARGQSLDSGLPPANPPPQVVSGSRLLNLGSGGMFQKL